MGTERKMVDSGVDWIGEVPEGWDATALKNILSLSRERTTGNDFYVGMENISSGSGRLISGEDARTVENGIDSAFRKGDILFGKLRPYLRKVWMADRDGSCSTEFLVMDSGAIETNRFLFYTLLTDEFCSLVNNNCKGVKMPRADWENIGSTPVVLPPLPEQQAITTFLDHHVGLIDRERELIAQKIGLLKDKRKALIFECVTGKRTIVEAQHLAGVDDWSDIVGSGPLVAVPTPGKDDPFVKGGRLVDSGVEWIGEVPEGWEINRLSEVFHSHKRGATPAYLDESDFKIVNQACLSSYRLDTSKAKPATPMIGQRGRFSEGDLLVASTGGGVMGKCALATMDGYCDSHVTILKPVEKISALLVFYWMSASFEWIQQFGKGSTNQIELQVKPLLTTAFPLPPINIQRSIATFLDHETNLIDREIELLETKSSLLADKRKALIFEAVTGKIDCTQP